MSALEAYKSGKVGKKDTFGHLAGNAGLTIGAGLAIWFVSFEAFLVYLVLQAILLVRAVRH